MYYGQRDKKQTDISLYKDAPKNRGTDSYLKKTSYKSAFYLAFIL